LAQKGQGAVSARHYGSQPGVTGPSPAQSQLLPLPAWPGTACPDQKNQKNKKNQRFERDLGPCASGDLFEIFVFFGFFGLGRLGMARLGWSRQLGLGQ